VLGLIDRSAGEFRQASDGWHVLLRVSGVEHRLWLSEPPVIDGFYAAELPFDDAFDVRTHAARRLCRALNGRAAGPAFHELSLQHRQRLALALRALDARADGNTDRVIAEVLFGAKRIPERAWKTHDLRNRTIRLVQKWLRPDARRLSRTAAAIASQEVARNFGGVSKTHPVKIGIPLRGPTLPS
jgi:hypothetical protein